MDLEGSGYDLLKVLSRHIPRVSDEIHIKPSLKMCYAPTNIFLENFPYRIRDNSERNFKNIMLEVVNWIHLVQYWDIMNTVINLPIL